MTNFDRANLRELNADIRSALATVAAKHGITITVEGGRFSPTEFRTKLVASTGGTLSADDRARREFEKMAPLYGLLPDDFGVSFNTSHGSMVICGIKPKSHKYPILGRSARGAIYKHTINQVLMGLGRKPRPEYRDAFENRQED